MRENKHEKYKIEFHVAGLCFRGSGDDIQILIAKRTNNRSLYPGKWECGGGPIHPGENCEEAVARQMKDELGIIVDKAIVFGTYEMDVPDLKQKKIPGVKFVCLWKNYANGTEPQIDSQEFSEWKWQLVDNLNEVDFIQNVDDDIRNGLKVYKSLN